MLRFVDWVFLTAECGGSCHRECALSRILFQVFQVQMSNGIELAVENLQLGVGHAGIHELRGRAVTIAPFGHKMWKLAGGSIHSDWSPVE